MKNILLILFVFIWVNSLFCQNEVVKFYLNSNDSKSYNIADIDKMLLNNKQSAYQMKIYLNGSGNPTSLEVSSIDSLTFEYVENIMRNLLIYSTSAPVQRFLLFDIDSIIFSLPPPPTPFIEDIDPTSAFIGDNITLTGTNFGGTQGTSSVTFSGATAINYSKWTDTEIIVKVPAGAQTGGLSVIVKGVHSNEKYFKVIPQIDAINPASGKVGTEITLTGTGFGIVQGSGNVYFNDVKSTEYVSWVDNEIKVKVPAEAVSGTVYVRIKSLSSNEVDFEVIETPVIISINPTDLYIGSDVTIYGSGFGSDQNNSIVKFNNIETSDYKNWSNTQIICTVPHGAVSGKVSVTTNSEKSNEVDYTIKEFLEAVLIPSGSFQMGNTGSMPSSMQPETPVHQVTIRNSFYMSKYEIQQDLYTIIMGSNPSQNKGGDNYPVDRVSFVMACDFCNKLSQREGLTKCYTINGNSVSCNWNADGWRLPTEAEWEYACKAGTSSDYYNGSSESNLANTGWYSGNSGEVSHPVGQKVPNSFGLYDMLGNQSELCWDWIGTYSSGSQTDPTGPPSGTWKVARGGSWHQGADKCRSSMRGWIDAIDMQSSALGFRVVRVNK